MLNVSEVKIIYFMIMSQNFQLTYYITYIDDTPSLIHSPEIFQMHGKSTKYSISIQVWVPVPDSINVDLGNILNIFFHRIMSLICLLNSLKTKYQ